MKILLRYLKPHKWKRVTTINVRFSFWLKFSVAIHNKNGKGLLQNVAVEISNILTESQSTIKMEKGYYGRLRKNIAKIQVVVAIHNKNGKGLLLHLCRLALACVFCLSQSTIKMEKGYYIRHHHCGIKHS